MNRDNLTQAGDGGQDLLDRMLRDARWPEPESERVERLRRRIRRVRLLVHGQFARAELFAAARRSRCCLYLSDDDRGPLALAEILLAGCPTVGIPRGAPFVEPGCTGVLVERFRLAACLEALERCHQLDRPAVAALAAQRFDTERILAVVLEALRAALLAEKVASWQGVAHARATARRSYRTPDRSRHR